MTPTVREFRPGFVAQVQGIEFTRRVAPQTVTEIIRVLDQFRVAVFRDTRAWMMSAMSLSGGSLASWSPRRGCLERTIRNCSMPETSMSWAGSLDQRTSQGSW